MAQPTNLYDTYDTTGIREDLVDVIYNISPEDTPILSAIPRTIAKQTKHEWQIDSLAAAATNSVIEGDDATIEILATNHYTLIFLRINLVCFLCNQLLFGIPEVVHQASPQVRHLGL